MELTALHLVMELKNKHLNSKVVSSSAQFVKNTTHQPLEMQTAHAQILVLLGK